MNRKDELTKYFNEHRYFKIVCGAGNEDPVDVYKLVLVYTLAGTTAVDISANVEVVKASVSAINKAFEIAPKLGINIETRPFINVSIGLKGDPHVMKAQILREKCVDCGDCISACLQDAICINELNETTIIAPRCIGCNDCFKACRVGAIEFYHKRVNLETVIPQCIKEGAETLELHAIIEDDEATMADWKLIDKLCPDNYISMCLDRQLLSNQHAIQRLSDASEITGDRFVVQADGVPMSGGDDSYNTTLQAIAMADIVQKSKLPVKILLSGGTNSFTGKLAKLCNITAHGVSIGTFARQIIKEYIKQDDFENNLDLITLAVARGKQLIDMNLEAMRD